MDWSRPSTASSSGSSTDEPSVSTWKYDVFLSFRGDDTRKGVVSHLYDELQNRSGIRTFKDDIRLEVGAPISQSLWEAIEDSRFAIVVLSTNYASSVWCLDELQHIFRYMKGKDRVLPLFYSVDPSDVRNQRGSFQAAFTMHEKRHKKDLQKVNDWRIALGRVGNLSGWNADKFMSETELVKRIVQDMSRKIFQVPSPIVDFEPSVSTGLHVPNEIFEEFNCKPISVGPYGSDKELKLKHFNDGVHSTVRQLVIHHYPKHFCKSVLCIQIEYVSDDGNSVWSDKHGYPAFHVEKDTVKLDYPEEYLTSIHGRYDKILGTTAIISLTLKSNKNIYGPFGGVLLNGNNFSIEEPGCKIVGFHGKSDDRFFSSRCGGLRAIGAHFRPIE